MRPLLEQLEDISLPNQLLPLPFGLGLGLPLSSPALLALGGEEGAPPGTAGHTAAALSLSVSGAPLSGAAGGATTPANSAAPAGPSLSGPGAPDGRLWVEWSLWRAPHPLSTHNSAGRCFAVCAIALCRYKSINRECCDVGEDARAGCAGVGATRSDRARA